MSQCIHSGSCRDFRRQTAGHLRIKDCITRDQVQIHQCIFVMCIGIRNDGCDGGLRTGTCRSRNGNKRRNPSHDPQKSCHLSNGCSGPNHTGSSTFGCVHGGAAADGDESVAFVFKIQLLNGVDGVDGRVRFHVCKHEVRDPRSIQCFRNTRCQFFADAGTGNDDGFRHIALFQQFRNLCNAVGAGSDDGSSPVQTSCSDVEDPLEHTIVAFFQSGHYSSPFRCFFICNGSSPIRCIPHCCLPVFHGDGADGTAFFAFSASNTVVRVKQFCMGTDISVEQRFRDSQHVFGTLFHTHPAAGTCFGINVRNLALFPSILIELNRSSPLIDDGRLGTELGAQSAVDTILRIDHMGLLTLSRDRLYRTLPGTGGTADTFIRIYLICHTLNLPPQLARGRPRHRHSVWYSVLPACHEDRRCSP